MERHAKKSRKTYDEIQKQFERSFSHWKHRKLSSLNNDDVELLHRTIGDTRGQYAANRAIELLRAIYNKAVEWKLCKGDNPTETVTMFVERSRVRILQADEFERFFTAVEEEQDQDIKDFVLILLYCGARKSNVLAMSWADIDLKAGTWTIPGEQTKKRASANIAPHSERTGDSRAPEQSKQIEKQIRFSF